MKKYAVGADIGGSHISCALIDLEKKTILKDSSRSQKVNNKAGAEEILNTWSNTINMTMSLVNKEDLSGIGFAMPGPFKYEEGIALFTQEVDKYETLNETNISKELSKM